MTPGELDALLLDSVEDAVVVTSPDGEIVRWNKAAERLYGWTTEEALGRNVSDVTVPRIGRDEAETIMDQLRRGETWRGEFLVQRRDQSTFWAEVTDSAIFDRAGNLVALIGVSRDITEKKAAAELLSASEERWRTLADALPFLVTEATPQGELDFYNRRWEDVTGRSREWLLDHGWQELVHPDDLPELAVCWTGMVASGQPGHCDWRLRQADGSYRWQLGSATPVHDSRGVLHSWIGALADIDDLKQAEARLEQLLVESRSVEVELTRLNAAKDEFLAMISHELRTPLTVISGLAEAVAAGRLRYGDPSAGEALEELRLSARRLKAMIENLLTLARSGHEQPVLEPILLQRQVLGVADDYDIRASLPDELPPALGNPGWVDRIVSNFIENALKYGGGPEDILIRGVSRDGVVEVHVLDRGPGITASEQQDIFEPFYRGESATVGRPGAGVGLAVCRRLAELQEGEVGVAPRRGGGSDFFLALKVFTVG